MADKTVTITVIMKVRTGYEERARGILKSLIASSRQEDGCLEYRMYEALLFPLVFMLYMRWRDEEAYGRHMASPSVKAFDELHSRQLLAGPYDLKRWMPLE